MDPGTHGCSSPQEALEAGGSVTGEEVWLLAEQALRQLLMPALKVLPACRAAAVVTMELKLWSTTADACS